MTESASVCLTIAPVTAWSWVWMGQTGHPISPFTIMGAHNGQHANEVTGKRPNNEPQWLRPFSVTTIEASSPGAPLSWGVRRLLNSNIKLLKAMNLSHKSRFRLTLELYICGFVMLIGMSFMPVGFLMVAPVILYLQPLSRELKSRREPLAKKQKNILFAIQSSFCGIIIAALLVIALLKETALAWIIFALISLLMLGSLYYGYEQIYKNERAI
jgi:hypothetical protein